MTVQARRTEEAMKHKGIKDSGKKRQLLEEE